MPTVHNLVDTQREVIALLQDRLARLAPNTAAGGIQAGAAKDLALTLAVAIDKYELLLRCIREHPQITGTPSIANDSVVNVDGTSVRVFVTRTPRGEPAGVLATLVSHDDESHAR